MSKLRRGELPPPNVGPAPRECSFSQALDDALATSSMEPPPPSFFDLKGGMFYEDSTDPSPDFNYTCDAFIPKPDPTAEIPSARELHRLTHESSQSLCFAESEPSPAMDPAPASAASPADTQVPESEDSISPAEAHRLARESSSSFLFYEELPVFEPPRPKIVFDLDERYSAAPSGTVETQSLCSSDSSSSFRVPDSPLPLAASSPSVEFYEIPLESTVAIMEDTSAPTRELALSSPSSSPVTSPELSLALSPCTTLDSLPSFPLFPSLPAVSVALQVPEPDQTSDEVDDEMITHIETPLPATAPVPAPEVAPSVLIAISAPTTTLVSAHLTPTPLSARSFAAGVPIVACALQEQGRTLGIFVRVIRLLDRASRVLKKVCSWCRSALSL